jgi:hypothetical protein
MPFRFVRALPAAALAASMLAAPASADEILEQLDLARELYLEGDYAGAALELDFALGDLRTLVAGQYAETMPEAPEGWTAQRPSTEGGAAMMGGGSIITRTYNEDDGQGRIEAQLIVDNPMVQGMAAIFANPALIAAQPNTERLRIGRESGALQFDPDRGSGEVTLVLGGRILAKLEGRGLGSKEVLADMMRAWDLDAVKRLAGM